MLRKHSTAQHSTAQRSAVYPHKQQSKYAPIRARQSNHADRVGSSQHVEAFIRLAVFSKRTKRSKSIRPTKNYNHSQRSLADVTLSAHCSFSPSFIMRQGRGSEAADAVFAYRQKKPFHTGARTGCHHLINICVCVTFVLFTDCESCRRPISTHTRDLWKRASANAWDVFHRTPFRGGRGRRAAVDFVVCFGYGGISFFFSFFFVCSNAHGLLQV